ncbi:MAG: hypothetical protein ACRDRK_02705 [Pseudonocardia sp.]
MTVILDAGAFVAIERGNVEVAARIKRERLAGHLPVTHGGIIGQVWRGGTGRQVGLARAIPLVKIVPLDGKLGKRAGELLARAGSRDVIDAALILLARDNDLVITSDPGDLRALAAASGIHLEIIPV